MQDPTTLTPGGLAAHAAVSFFLIAFFILIIFYSSRCLAFFVTWIARPILWFRHKAEFSIGASPSFSVHWSLPCLSLLTLGSISFSILGGHILIKDVHYSTPDFSVKVLHGKLVLRYWIKNVRSVFPLQSIEHQRSFKGSSELMTGKYRIYHSVSFVYICL
jgi:hypothetical protein